MAGGAELYLYEVFSRLVNKGHKVTVLCSRAEGQSRHEVLDGFEIYRMGKRSNFNFFVPTAVRSILRHKRIDVVVDDLNKIPFYSPLFTRKQVLPMLMHIFRSTIYRETNFVFASYVFLTERIIPYLYPSSKFVAISNSTADDLKAIGVKSRIYVIPPGIPKIPQISAGARQKNLVVYVGRVKKYKSIDHFVRAMAIVKNRNGVEAIVVGDGDAKEDLIDLSKKLNVQIRFTGFVSEEEKYRIYSKARVVVQPSIKEGWGLTAIEAQSCGTPVVCADSPGLREVVLNGETGFLHKYGSIDTLAERIIQLLDDEEKWRKFSVAAKNWANSFSWDKAAASLEQILKSQSNHEL